MVLTDRRLSFFFAYDEELNVSFPSARADRSWTLRDLLLPGAKTDLGHVGRKKVRS